MPKPTEELRRRIVADINAGVPGAKLGSERDLAERYSHQPLQPASDARGAGGGGPGAPRDRPGRRHLHQPRPGAAQPVRRRRRARLPRQSGLRRGDPRAVDEDHRAGPHHAAGAAARRRRLRRRDPARPAGRRVADLLGAGAVSGRGLSRAAREAARRIALRDPRERLRARHLPRGRADRGRQRHRRTRPRCWPSSPGRRCC